MSAPHAWERPLWDAWRRDDPDAALNRVRAETLREAADTWQQGEWADAPRRGDRIQERLANAQFVTDWLRDHADRIEAEP